MDLIPSVFGILVYNDFLSREIYLYSRDIYRFVFTYKYKKDNICEPGCMYAVVFLLTSLPILNFSVILCLAKMLGAANLQASSKSVKKLKKISTRDLKDYVKKAILNQQF